MFYIRPHIFLLVSDLEWFFNLGNHSAFCKVENLAADKLTVKH